jgi:UDPglucose 6-dehydrogenase
VRGRTVGLLGLAFKAGTDDVRESPAIGVARELLARGVRVQAFDPAAAANAARELPGLHISESAEAALDGADAAVIATEWPAFKAIDWAAARSRLRRPLVVDGRRLLDRDAMTALGYTYIAVGTDRSIEGAVAERALPAPEVIT